VDKAKMLKKCTCNIIVTNLSENTLFGEEEIIQKEKVRKNKVVVLSSKATFLTMKKNVILE